MSYLSLDDAALRKAVARAKRLVRQAEQELGVKHDVILTTGLSGDIVGSHVALGLKRRHVVLRKKGASTHGSRVENYHLLYKQGGVHPNVLVLDDFVSTGRTVANILMDALLNMDAAWMVPVVTLVLYGPAQKNPLGMFPDERELMCEAFDSTLEYFFKHGGPKTESKRVAERMGRLRTHTEPVVWLAKHRSPCVVQMGLSTANVMPPVYGQGGAEQEEGAREAVCVQGVV